MIFSGCLICETFWIEGQVCLPYQIDGRCGSGVARTVPLHCINFIGFYPYDVTFLPQMSLSGQSSMP
jgi:hypothetical protein